jgi:hypothetical protein
VIGKRTCLSRGSGFLYLQCESFSFTLVDCLITTYYRAVSVAQLSGGQCPEPWLPSFEYRFGLQSKTCTLTRHKTALRHDTGYPLCSFRYEPSCVEAEPEGQTERAIRERRQRVNVRAQVRVNTLRQVYMYRCTACTTLTQYVLRQRGIPA